MQMRLADFIDANLAPILAEWEAFAATLLPAAAGLDPVALRDHAEQMLQAVAADLRMPQTVAQQTAKSRGLAPSYPGAAETAAQTHALLRAADGFTIRQLVAEYRALRASVLRLWGASSVPDAHALEDMGRFNEAVDQAIAESVDFYATEVDRWRALFLGMISHDLRSPLNAVLMTSRVISAASGGTPLSEHTASIIRSGERMRELLDDLLDYNRASLDIGIRAAPEPVDLVQVCRDEIALLEAALPQARIEFEAPAALRGHWDPSRMRQVLGNLVTNAAHYGAAESAIRVELCMHDDMVRLSVENSGPDIPADLMKSLFEPLRRHAAANAHGERVSLGLGLFIVRQVALAHGGDVAVQSSGGITRFTMTLPYRPAQG